MALAINKSAEWTTEKPTIFQSSFAVEIRDAIVMFLQLLNVLVGFL